MKPRATSDVAKVFVNQESKELRVGVSQGPRKAFRGLNKGRPTGLRQGH